MAGADDLSKKEQSVLTLHPHWKTVLMPMVILIGLVIAAAVLLAVIPHGRLAGPERIAVGALALIIAITFTLIRISDVSFSQGLIDRVLGCGRLVIESAGEHGQLVLNEIPGVAKVQATLFQLVEDEQDRLAREDR